MTAAALTIEPTTVDDLARILEIQVECKLSPWSEHSYKDALKAQNFFFYTAKADNSPVGFILARLITSNRSLEILNIAVSLTKQNQQIGEGLINQLFTVVEGKAEKVLLEVREGNRQAIGFYNKYGFYPVGVRKNYYSNPVENALLMEKRLD